MQRQLCVSLKRIILKFIHILHVLYSEGFILRNNYHKNNFDIDTKVDFGNLKYINGNTRILCLMKRVMKIHKKFISFANMETYLCVKTNLIEQKSFIEWVVKNFFELKSQRCICVQTYVLHVCLTGVSKQSMNRIWISQTYVYIRIMYIHL